MNYQPVANEANFTLVKGNYNAVENTIVNNWSDFT